MRKKRKKEGGEEERETDVIKIKMVWQFLEKKFFERKKENFKENKRNVFNYNQKIKERINKRINLKGEEDVCLCVCGQIYVHTSFIY